VSCLFLLTGVVTQRIVLNREVASQTAGRPYEAKGRHLVKLGVRPPCVIGSSYVAYYVGCTGRWTGQSLHELLASTPQGANGWKLLHLPKLKMKVYVPK
jgi:hypothetical protein